MTTAPHAHLRSWYASEQARQPFVDDLFDKTARHYDWICKAMALGTGQFHRRRALHRAGFTSGLRLLDLATGTGLVAQAALELGALPEQIVGCDPSRGMLDENQKRRAIRLVRSGGERLPFRDGAFDFVTIGYALRHVADLALLFAECARVLGKGGRLLVLEISRPESRIGRALARLYMRGIVPLVARLKTGDREAARLMQYYWDTIEACVPPEAIVAALRGAGFPEPKRFVSGGVLRDYVAVR